MFYSKGSRVKDLLINWLLAKKISNLWITAVFMYFTVFSKHCYKNTILSSIVA